MDRRTPAPRRTVERIKSILIVLLSISAIVLAGRLSVSGFFRSADPAPAEGPAGQETDSAPVWPVRFAAITGTGVADERAVYGAAYDTQALGEAYQLVDTLLSEGLGSFAAAQPISQSRWRTALSRAPGLYFEFPGPIPLSVLSGWSAGQAAVEVPAANELLLTVEDEQVWLFYCDGDSGEFYACPATVIEPARLSAAVSAFTPNGAFFAFTDPDYAALRPYSLLLPETPRIVQYTAAAPLGDEQTLDAALRALRFDPAASSSYRNNTDIVVLNESDTLRISDLGLLTYQSGDTARPRYTVASAGERPTDYEAVLTCHRVAAAVLGSFSGAAQLNLLTVYEKDGAQVVEFAYFLDGAQVQILGQSCAARFTVTGAQITDFTLYARSYTATEGVHALLPVRQAAAAVRGMEDMEQGRLSVAYQDSGDQMRAGWAVQRS